ncbi:MAG: hypothetical protein SO293_07765 [Alloprevotella sp.]|nr:hypothetical protein [Alloprevotella sp.]
MKKSKITKNSIVVENGNIKTLLTEQTISKGYMPIEEARRLTIERLRKRWEMLNGNGG